MQSLDFSSAPVLSCPLLDSWQPRFDPAISEQASHEPICVATDSVGVYPLRGPPAANYLLDAMAPGFVPATFRVSACYVRFSDVLMLLLRAGEVRANIDLTLKPGGIEVIGTVVDVGGGPVVHALVRGQSLQIRDAGQPTAFTDAQGRRYLEPQGSRF